MGCAQSGQVSDISPFQTLQSPVGILRITVTTSKITHYESMMSTMDPYTIIKLSNQQMQTATKRGMDPSAELVFNESFTFVVNKGRTVFGRVLELEMWDLWRVGRNQIGFGIVDLDGLVKFKMQGKQAGGSTPGGVEEVHYKCWINHNSVPSGYVNLIASFQELPYETVHFRFESAIIRKKTRLVGNMNCRVKVIAGEEQISTSSCLDTKERPPSWLNDSDILKLKLPITEALKQCKVHLMDGNELVGQIAIPIGDIMGLEKGKETKYAEDTYLNAEQTATIKYSIVRGETAVFEKKDIMGSKIVARKDPVKEEKKEEEKKEVKKQEPKKEEPKKEQPKKQELKKQQPKKDEPKKEEPKQPKKEDPKKEEPKKQQPKKQEPKKEQPKKEQPKKEEPKKQPENPQPKPQPPILQPQNKNQAPNPGPEQKKPQEQPVQPINQNVNTNTGSEIKNVSQLKNINDEEKQRLKLNQSDAQKTPVKDGKVEDVKGGEGKKGQQDKKKDQGKKDGPKDEEKAKVTNPEHKEDKKEPQNPVITPNIVNSNPEPKKDQPKIIQIQVNPSPQPLPLAPPEAISQNPAAQSI